MKTSRQFDSQRRLRRAVSPGIAVAALLLYWGAAIVDGSAGRSLLPSLATAASVPGSLSLGHASWYGSQFHGAATASGEAFDMNGLTAAHRTLPLGSYVQVKNLENGRTVVVKINDRGPYAKGRSIDLSYGAAQQLEMVRDGEAPVEITVLDGGA
jgi:rare lipoprotein A (peptidoglycan hydrolase)